MSDPGGNALSDAMMSGGILERIDNEKKKARLAINTCQRATYNLNKCLYSRKDTRVALSKAREEMLNGLKIIENLLKEHPRETHSH